MGERASLEVSGLVAHDAESVFLLLSDYSRVHTVIEGLAPLAPLGAETGVGARFSSHFTFGGRTHGVELRLAEARPTDLVVWAGLGGEDRSIAFSLAEGGGQTSVTIRASYTAPSGFGAALARPLVTGAIRQAAQTTLRRLGQGPAPH